jgi:hypothetical protein
MPEQYLIIRITEDETNKLKGFCTKSGRTQSDVISSFIRKLEDLKRFV